MLATGIKKALNVLKHFFTTSIRFGGDVGFRQCFIGQHSKRKFTLKNIYLTSVITLPLKTLSLISQFGTKLI